MKPDFEKWSLVLAGHWNTAILSPDWLAEKVFGVKELQIMYPVLGGSPPLFEAGDMRMMVRRDRVVFFPQSNEESLLRRIETAARNVLDILPHTPITAFGENFHYVVDDLPSTSPPILASPDMDGLESFGAAEETAVRRSIKVDDHQLNLTISSGDEVRIDFNYHYDVRTAEEAASQMENTFAENHDHGLRLLGEVYGLSLDTDYEEESDDAN